MRAALISMVASFQVFSASAATPVVRGSSASAVDPVFACRDIADGTARLACFDRTVADMQSAVRAHDLTFADRAAVRKAKRSLFGFNIPSLAIFGDGGDHAKQRAQIDQEERQITATVRSSRQGNDGNWIVTLDDGAIWHQTDGTIALPPRSGDTVVIQRGALGSYFLRVGKQPGVKARREG